MFAIDRIAREIARDVVPYPLLPRLRRIVAGLAHRLYLTVPEQVWVAPMWNDMVHHCRGAGDAHSLTIST